MTALEVTAGGKLFNVIVDTESTGKQLLQSGNIRRRVTIIPLNKIQAHTVRSSQVQHAAAKLVGKEKAELALYLVGYDEKLRSAMEYVFGSTFVAKLLMLPRRLHLTGTFAPQVPLLKVISFSPVVF